MTSSFQAKVAVFVFNIKHKLLDSEVNQIRTLVAEEKSVASTDNVFGLAHKCVKVKPNRAPKSAAAVVNVDRVCITNLLLESLLGSVEVIQLSIKGKKSHAILFVG
jgi:hypothetical protein